MVDGGMLEQVDSFIYLGSRITSTDCVVEVKSRLAMGMAVMVKLTGVWKNKSISTTSENYKQNACVVHLRIDRFKLNLNFVIYA